MGVSIKNGRIILDVNTETEIYVLLEPWKRNCLISLNNMAFSGVAYSILSSWLSPGLIYK